MSHPEATTHRELDRRLCGEPVAITPGRARVRLRTVVEMVADAHGLVHGGFVFGLADHAAMLANGDPNVVLGAAEVRFLAPVAVGQVLLAEAVADAAEGKKHPVSVRVWREEGAGETEGEPVFTGTFVCYVLPHHVLAGSPGSGAEKENR